MFLDIFSLIIYSSRIRISKKSVQTTINNIMYGILTEELVIREIRIDEAAGRGDSDSRMTSFEVIMPLKLQSTKILIYSI